MADTSHANWLARCLGNSPSSPLADDDLEAMVAMAEVRSVDAGAVLLHRDDPSDDVYILERGRVATTRQSGGRVAMLQILHAGDVFGDVGLFLGRPAPVDAVVLEDAEVLRLAGPDLVRLVSTRPRIAVRWMVSMAARLADTQDRLEELLSGPLDHQLASLLHHAVDDSGQVVISQELLAKLLGARRPSITRSLSSLQKQGLIKKRYGRIQVLDAPALGTLSR